MAGFMGSRKFVAGLIGFRVRMRSGIYGHC